MKPCRTQKSLSFPLDDIKHMCTSDYKERGKRPTPPHGIRVLSYSAHDSTLVFTKRTVICLHSCWSLSNSSGNLLLDMVDNTRVCDGAEITKLVPFTSHNLAHDTAHDLEYKENEPVR